MKKRKPSGIGGSVDMPLDQDETYFAKLYPRLSRALTRIKGASILYERDWSGDTGRSGVTSNSFSFDDDDDDFEEDWGDTGAPGNSFSYHLFFLGLTDPAMKVACESETQTDDEGILETEDPVTLETVPGEETYGYLVGISLLAPIAMVQFDAYARFDDGSSSCPELRDEWHAAAHSRLADRGEVVQGLGDGTRRALDRLKTSIARVLRSLGLRELPSDVARTEVPGLRAGDEAFVGQEHTLHPITVQDAFFFAGP